MIDIGANLLLSTMTTEENPDLQNLANHNHHNPHLLDWPEDSIPFLPSFLEEEPYSLSNDLTGYDWWANPQDNNIPDPLLATSTVASLVGPATAISNPMDTKPIVFAQFEPSKKRKLPNNHSNNQCHRSVAAEEMEGNNSSDSEINRKPPVATSGRKAYGKITGANGSNKEVRWAEQLINPLAAAIDASNISRVQHLLYVLQELASLTGDANHRLAFYGYRALTRHLSTPNATDQNQIPYPLTFTSVEPKLFQSALIKFHEVSPWFAFPNALTNASILQILNQSPNPQNPKTLHIVDLGVSHGIQWPTLLEALTRSPGRGSPPLVKLTVAGDSLPPVPFSSAPHGYDFTTPLLRYPKSIDLSLKIHTVKDLTPQSIPHSDDETLIICSQFRTHNNSSEFIQSVKSLKPDLMVLTEIDAADAGGSEKVGFATRAELMWRFLDSSSAAFKGRDCAERRLMEGEMARVLEEGWGKWRERMILGLGFRELGFGEEAVDAGRALLRKYDGNWVMKMTETAAGLWWKGHPVSACSLWKKEDDG